MLASVKAPFLYPKNSLANRSSENVEQLIAIKGFVHLI